MKKNIHQVERITRVFIGLILLTMAFIGPANPWFLLGFIPVLTGLSGWCPFYRIMGISTCRNNQLKM